MGFLAPIISALTGLFTTSAGAVTAGSILGGVGSVGGAIGAGTELANLVKGGSSAPKDITAPPTSSTSFAPPPPPSTPTAPQIQTAANAQATGGGGLSSSYVDSLLSAGGSPLSPDALSQLKGYFST